MLKPAKMQRVGVIGLRDERGRVVSLLHDLGVVQIEPLSKSVVTALRTETDSAISKEVSEELLRVRSLMSALPASPVAERRGFSSLTDLMEVADSVKIDGEVAALKQNQERLASRIDGLRNQIALVKNLDFINADLSVFDLESATSFFGALSKDSYEQFRKGVSSLQGVMVQSNGTDPVKVVVIVPKAALEKFGSVIQAADVKLERIHGMRGTPAQALASVEGELSSAQSELGRIDQGLRAVSEKSYATLSSVEEQLSIESRKLEVINNLGFTESSFVLEGWVPQKSEQTLKDALASHSSSTVLFEIPSETKAPTLMETPKRLRFFESFVRFYSLPQSNEWDPTILFAFTFPIFFGLMLGDVGYGVIILLIAIWIIRRVNSGMQGKSLIPGALRKFAKNIFQPSQFRKLAMAMIPGSILGIVFGFIFNAYFGFHVNQYLFSALNNSLKLGLSSQLTTNGAILDPISSRGLKTLLLLAGYIGLFEVSLGLVMGMFNARWMGETRHIFGKLGWLFVAWGIVLIGLTVLHHGDANPVSNPLAGVYIVLALAGIGLIAYGEGAQALIELPSIVSHILSYTRLVGILLASVALALVVDTLFLGDLAAGVGLAIVGVVILIVGQLFNLVLALFEPGIQGARLIYVEFFSKFYHGQGRAFTPFRGKRTHTLSELEMMDSRKAAQPAAVEKPLVATA